MLFAAAAAAGGMGVPQASASTLCQSHYGKLCGMTERCKGTIFSQCITEYYYFGALEEEHEVR